MTSSLCVAEEHEVCTKRFRQQNGKLFSCDCPCHPIIVYVKPVEVDEDDEED